jgi:hypothetical protein
MRKPSFQADEAFAALAKFVEITMQLLPEFCFWA